LNALLVRVGVDQSIGGGSWNGPVDCRTGEFVYVPIPETHEIRPGLQRPYVSLLPALSRFGVELPAHLGARHMHLDPDFSHLTYGDANQRAQQLQMQLSAGDLIVFYASLRDTHSKTLLYAIIGLFVVRDIRLAAGVAEIDWDINAHSRRLPGPTDLIVCAKPGVSGRLRRCLPIGSYRNGAYRVRRDLLEKWGGLSVKDGWLQRSARLPRFREPERFSEWLGAQNPLCMASNN
jgi:hypothetical protein